MSTAPRDATRWLTSIVDDIRTEQARPYWEAARTLGARLDRLPTDDPDRPRLLSLRRAARTRAEAIERGDT